MTPEAKITAAALGELDEELSLDADARAEMAAIQAIAEALGEELGAEPQPTLTDAQRTAIEAAATAPSAWGLVPHTVAATAAAAALMLAFTFESMASREAPLQPLHAYSYAEPMPSTHGSSAPSRQAVPEPETETDIPDKMKFRKLARTDRVTRSGEGEYRVPALLPAEHQDPLAGSTPEYSQAQVARRSGAGATVVVDGTSADVGRRLARPQEHKRLEKAPENAGAATTDRARLEEAIDLAESMKREGLHVDELIEANRKTALEPSTFSIDVDTASYAIVRRHLLAHRLPPPDGVRIEELINYFPYADPPPAPSDPHPVAVRVGVGDCLWDGDRRLVRIGIKGREVAAEARPPSNLVFLVDVSGSMQQRDKLPLLKRSLRQLVSQLRAEDRVAIVVYAGAAGQVLPSTSGDRTGRIEEALLRLEAGGSTNGGAGIELAYRVARENFIEDGVNRVVLATDGDFNVGITDDEELVELIQRSARAGVELSVVGFGSGYLGDARMEELSNKGNGNYAFIDSDAEAHKVLVEQIGGTLQTIAKDVKVQVHFNPDWVHDYRLIGYNNRILAAQDFDDDAKDAGEIGSGHTVTALYEVMPREDGPADEPALQVKIRYKPPQGSKSILLEHPVDDLTATNDPDARWAAAVAGFGTLLRGEERPGTLTWDQVRQVAQISRGRDPDGYRREFIDLIGRAQRLTTGEAPPAASPRSPAPQPEADDAPPVSPPHRGRELFWIIIAVGFSLVAGPLAWVKGAAMRARDRDLGLARRPAPTLTTLIGITTTILAVAAAALALA